MVQDRLDRHQQYQHYQPGNSLWPFLGWLSDPFKWLSDLQLGDEKVTLDYLEHADVFVGAWGMRVGEGFEEVATSEHIRIHT